VNKSDKPRNTRARPIADFVGTCVSEAFARQGFSSIELVTHWEDIVGPDISAHAEPMKLQWPRQTAAQDGARAPGEPATLVLRVEGPAAIEIQHLAGVILERVNRFFGWQAVGRIAIRQAPLQRRKTKRRPAPPDPAVAQRIAGSLAIEDEGLKAALGRLGAAVKRG
jgi:hypothetical protein